jgi:CheY-like chemotaxis protein/CRP-like cAMP-binding protein
MNKILIIEDDIALRENTAELLELAHYDVFTAANGLVGVALAKKELPDLIVCDIMMPEVDGYEVLEKLAADSTTNKIPFIFLSAKTEYKAIRKGMNMGADDYLTKPFEEEQLLNAIASRIAKAAILKAQAGAIVQPFPEEDAFRSLDEVKNFFNDKGEVYSFKKGETIYKEGSRSFRIYLVLNGVVKTHKTDESGKELITALHKSGDFLGFTSISNNVAYKESAEALEDVKMVGVLKVVLEGILEHNKSISLEFIELLTLNVDLIKKQLLQMAYSSVRKKTAQTILQFAYTLNKNPQENICIARNDLAGVAGIATESLIRTLSCFRKEGLIETEGRNIRILSINGLALIE